MQLEMPTRQSYRDIKDIEYTLLKGEVGIVDINLRIIGHGVG